MFTAFLSCHCLPYEIVSFAHSKAEIQTHYRSSQKYSTTIEMSLGEQGITYLIILLSCMPAICFLQVLRFMGDPHLNGAQENMFGNYIIQRGLTSPGLRDEILSQVVNQVWRNVNSDNAERGWLLLSACVCSFAPSAKMDKYLLK